MFYPSYISHFWEKEIERDTEGRNNRKGEKLEI